MAGGQVVALVSEKEASKRAAWLGLLCLSLVGYLSDLSRTGLVLRVLQVASLRVFSFRGADGGGGRQWWHLSWAALGALALLHASGAVVAPVMLHVFADDVGRPRGALLAMDALLAVFVSLFWSSSEGLP